MYILSCLNPCCLYKQNKNMYYYPPHFPLKWERSCLCMAIPCIALRESSLWVPRRSGRIQERVFIVTKLLHGFLGSLYALLYDFILAAIEWAQRDIRFWFRVSIPQLQYIYTTHTCWGFSFVWLVVFFIPPIFLFSLPVAVKRPTALLTLHLVCTLRRKKKYFEYDACWTRCLNQLYENTNLHLLSVWRGFPYRNQGLGFPKPKLEVQ